MSDITDSRDAVLGQLSGFVSDVYEMYEPGEIPTEDLLDPVTAATELQQDTGLSAQAAEAAMLGIPTTAGLSMLLEAEVDGEMYELEAEIYTNANPEDEDGDKIGFEVGETYDPDDFDEPIYMAYEYIDPETDEITTDFAQLEEPFTLLEATDEDGEDVDSFEPVSRNQQTADVESIEEELAQIREEQIRMQEEAEDGGAGIGFFDGSDDVRTLGIVAGAGALIALLFGR